MTNNMKHVYIIESGNGHKKIGVTKDIKRRINNLKTGVSTGIKSVWITDKLKNAKDIEDKLHEANKSIRLNGEWFDGEIDFCGINFYPPEINDYVLIDTKTGEEVDIKQCFNQFIASNDDVLDIDNSLFFEFIKLSGTQTSNILSYLISNCDGNNMIYKTQREITELTGVAGQTSKNVFNRLMTNGFLKKIRNGAYMINPLLIRHDGYMKEALLLWMWHKA